MTYADLRRDLLKRLHVSRQALHQRVQRRKREMVMSTQDATCVIAHELGMHVDRYIPADDLARVRGLIRDAGHGGELAPSPVARAQPRTESRGERRLELKFPSEFRLTDPILPASKLREAVQMARVYPLLYVLENSIREVIKRVMVTKYGPDWWDTQLASGRVKGVREAADGRRTQEKTRNSWHQRRGADPIDYTDLGQLLTIIQAKQADFIPAVIPDLAWFEQFMRELEPSRNVVCHMNPLSDLNERDVRNRLGRWNQMVRMNRQSIP